MDNLCDMTSVFFVVIAIVILCQRQAGAHCERNYTNFDELSFHAAPVAG